MTPASASHPAHRRLGRRRPSRSAGRDAGGQLRDWTRPLAPAGRRAPRLRQHPAPHARPAAGHPAAPKAHDGFRGSRNGVLPNASDRLAPARRRLGAPGTLWQQRATVRCALPEPPIAHVYLDVSGSMVDCCPSCGLLVPYVADGRARVFQFSTASAAAARGAAPRRAQHHERHRHRPVLEHALADRAVRRILVLTDGYTGRPSAEQAARSPSGGCGCMSCSRRSAWRRDLELASPPR